MRPTVACPGSPKWPWGWGFPGPASCWRPPQQGHVASPYANQLGQDSMTEMLSTFWIPSTQDDSSVVRVGFDCVNHLLQLVYSLTGIICRIIEKRKCAHVNYIIWWDGLTGLLSHWPSTAPPWLMVTRNSNALGKFLRYVESKAWSRLLGLSSGAITKSIFFPM